MTQKQSLFSIMGIVLSSLLLSACGINKPPSNLAKLDGPPLGRPLINVQRVPNPIPKHEPFSKMGNRSRYTVFQKQYHVLRHNEGFREVGLASWYGRKWHGRKTANGETYDMYAMTAAHKHLPLPTYLRVTNLENGKQIIVRVNDRGPFHGNRVIDLSYAAAVKLDLLEPGTAKVKIEAIQARGNPPLRLAEARKSASAPKERRLTNTSTSRQDKAKPYPVIVHRKPPPKAELGVLPNRLKRCGGSVLQ